MTTGVLTAIILMASLLVGTMAAGWYMMDVIDRLDMTNEELEEENEVLREKLGEARKW